MDVIRYIHISSGITIAVTGLLQILLKKGGRLHRIIGTVYFLAWPLVVVTGGLLGSFLITLLGGMGWYMAYMGYRFGRLHSSQLLVVDKIIIASSLLVSIGILGYGVYLLVKGATAFGIISSFFGVIFSILGIQDINGYIRGKNNRRLSGHPMEWLFEHYGRMYISYIAAMTAFTVIQNPFPIVLLNWITPTFVGTALIILTGRFYRKKYAVDPRK